MAFLILDIETVPRPSIDETVDKDVHKKRTPIYIERTGNDPRNVEFSLRDSIS